MAAPPTSPLVASNWRPVTVSVNEPVATEPRADTLVQYDRWPGVGVVEVEIEPPPPPVGQEVRQSALRQNVVELATGNEEVATVEVAWK